MVQRAEPGGGFDGSVVVPHNDGVAESGVACSIAARREDHEAVCWHRRITGILECVRGGCGYRIVREAKILSEPDALIAWFGEHGVTMERIGLEAGPLSQWLHAGMVKAGLSVELNETRHVRAAFKTMPVKTDKKDARGIAQLMRLGWFRPVHCKSLAAQEVRALLIARKLIQGKLHDIEMSIRGILRGFGLKVGATTRRTCAGRIRELIAGHSTLEAIVKALLKVREALVHEFAGFERKLRGIARQDENAQRLMTTPGADVCGGRRRAGAIPLIPCGGATLRIDAEEVSVGRNRS